MHGEDVALGRAAQLARRHLDLRERGRHLLRIDAPGIGEHHRPMHPMEQSHPELLLEQLDLVAHRRGGQYIAERIGDQFGSPVTPDGDQAVGGAFAWGVGEIPTLIITLVVVYQWSQSDVRERRRLDRASDRGGNQDVEDYNKMLEELAKRQDKRR